MHGTQTAANPQEHCCCAAARPRMQPLVLKGQPITALVRPPYRGYNTPWLCAEQLISEYTWLLSLIPLLLQIVPGFVRVQISLWPQG